MKSEYCFVPNLYTIDECKLISDSVLTNLMPKQDIPATGRTKTAQVAQTALGSVKERISKFINYSHHINNRMFGMDLYAPTDLDILNFNTYDSAMRGEYDWHRDAELGEVYDIKLTALLNLSTTTYIGGDFELWLRGPTAIKEFSPGSMIIFPSWMLHRVTPVTHGIRNTLAYFLTGPQFK